MTVKKEMALRNDRLRKQERLGCRILILVVLVKRCKGERTNRCNWSGMFAQLGYIVSLSAKVEDG
jgi:hypothetical protein